MVANHFHASPNRLHFFFKLLGGLLLFWGIVYGLHFVFYGDRLLPSNYVWIYFLIPAASSMELALRDRKRKSLAGLSRAAIWGVSQREMLFVLGTVFGILVMTKDDGHSRAFLGLFLFLYSVWIAWMNHVGRRMLHRWVHRTARRRTAHHAAMEPSPKR